MRARAARTLGRSVIDPATRIGAVHLTIARLDESIRFYESHLGFTLHRREARTAWLGAGGRDLLVLSDGESAPRVRGATGLYHFAVLVPTRLDLARALMRLAETGTVLQGAADHGVSEALYLADPDGNGIELYRDRPRAEWPFVQGTLEMAADPIDFDELASAFRPARDERGSGGGLAAGTTIGHVHLHVSRLDAARRFYVDVLGFELMQYYGRSALFVSAGGYHHHVGVNTWAGVGAPPPPPGAIGLKDFEVVLPSDAARQDVVSRVEAAGIPIERDGRDVLVRDPAGNTLRLKADPVDG